MKDHICRALTKSKNSNNFNIPDIIKCNYTFQTDDNNNKYYTILAGPVSGVWVPKEYGSSSTSHRRFQQWSTSKVFERLWTRLLKVYDDLVGIQWKWQSLDSVSVKAAML
jgi:hypothetical protein